MAGRYYMGIDFRRDHSFRVPRPDLSIKLNTPNACNDCHSDKSFSWAENQINKFYGKKQKENYTSILYDGFNSEPSAEKDLTSIIGNENYPAIIRATAISYLSNYTNPAVSSTIIKMLKQNEPLIRMAAINSFTTTDAELAKNVLFPLLSDTVKMVRLAAVNRLSGISKEYFSEDQLKILNKVSDEYYQSLLYTSDFPSGKYNLGNYFADKGDVDKAIRFYNDAIKLDSLFYPAKSNLAMLYYKTNRLNEAENLFLNLVKKNPEYKDGHYYLGLLYAEQGRYKEATENLELAAKEKSDNGRIYYNLGLLYQKLNDFKLAEQKLLQAYEKSPDDFDIIYALADYYSMKSNFDKALKYANELKEKFPNDPTGVRLLKYISEKL